MICWVRVIWSQVMLMAASCEVCGSVLRALGICHPFGF